MKMLKFFLVEMVLPLITAWFLMTLLVDIVAIPTVFKNISNLEEGGRIGMSIFGKFNCLEIFLALGVLAGVSSMKEKSHSIFGGIRDVFHVFAHRTSVAVGSAWAFMAAILVSNSGSI